MTLIEYKKNTSGVCPVQDCSAYASMVIELVTLPVLVNGTLTFDKDHTFILTYYKKCGNTQLVLAKAVGVDVP